MPSRPPAVDLLDVVREFLERDLLPTLSSDVWFQCKVAINILGIVRREVELRPGLEAAEQQRLGEILGKAGSIDDLNRELCAAIDQGTISEDSPDLIQHVRRTITDALRINNPKWID